MVTSVVPVIPPATVTFPTGMVESPVTEIPSVLPVEYRTIVLIVHPVAIVALPSGIGIVSVSGKIPFCYAKLGFDADLGISGAGYQTTGYDHCKDE